jgi:hypothetical protein
MCSGRCKATYTRRQWRVEYDGDPVHSELFESDGKWRCPRKALDDTDCCSFHLDRAEREDRNDLDDAELAQRLVAELRGDRPLADDGRPGELLGADLGSLVFSPETVDDPATPVGENLDHHLYLVGTTLDRLVVDGVTLGFDLTLDGVNIGPSERDEKRTDSVKTGAENREETERKNEWSEYPTDALFVRDGTMETVTLASTHVGGRVCIEGRAASLQGLRIQRGTDTSEILSIRDGATLDDTLYVEETGDRLDRIVVKGGAAIGTGDEDETGIRVTAPDSQETKLVVRGEGTTVSAITLADAHLESVFIENGAAVQNVIKVQETSLQGNLKMDGATGSPRLLIRDTGTDVTVVVVEDTGLRSIITEEGASVSTLRLRGAKTSVVGRVSISDRGTEIDSVRVSDGVDIYDGLWVHDGAAIRKNLRISNATVRSSDGRSEAVVVRGGETTVETVTLTDAATVHGLRVEDVTVEELLIEDARLESPRDGHHATPESESENTEATADLPAVMQVSTATVTSELTISGGEVEGRLSLNGATIRELKLDGRGTFAGPVEFRDETTVERSLTVCGDLTFDCPVGVLVDSARIVGDLKVRGTIDTASADGDSLRIVGGSVIKGALHLDGASVGRITVIDARIERRLTVVGDSTVEGGLVLERDAVVGGDLVVGSVPGADGSASAEPALDKDTTVSQTETDPNAPRTRLGGGIRLGNRADAHPTSGGVRVDGSLAVTGTALIPAGITLSDVVVGEDLRVVGEQDTAAVGAVDLFDCIIRGKVRVTRADLGAVVLRECRVGESVRIGAVDTGRHTTDRLPGGATTTGPDTINENDDAVLGDTTVEGTLSIVSTPIAENVIARRARLGGVAIEDATVDGRVRLATVHVDGGVTVKDSHVGGRLTVSAGRIGGLTVQESITDRGLRLGTGWQVRDREPPPDAGTAQDGPDDGYISAAELTVDGSPCIEEVTIGGNLTVDCSIAVGDSDSWPAFNSTDVEGVVRLRPRLDATRRVSLRNSTLPEGTLMITLPDGASEHVWYDLREASVGDLTVEFDGDSGETAIEHLLLLETRYDGFRFSALEGGIDADNARLHTLQGSGVVTRLDDVPSPRERIDPDRPVLYRLGELYARLPRTGTGYESDDPPPTDLEQTYLNAKNGASQVGDEDIAGQFFRREKRYRRRRYWERLCRVAEGTTSSGRTLGRWFANAVFDRMAVYGESPGRVVFLSAGIVAVFAGLFWLLLEKPPYGNQYIDTGVLPEWLALSLQPLTLSIESFVTLVLVGPADERLTPLAHLLGQIEGFLGVFLVALFVFTLTRSVRR